MKKLIVFLIAMLVLLAPGGLLKAAYNDFQTNGDITVSLTSPAVSLTIKNGANVESMTVNTGGISISLKPSSSITVESSTRSTMSHSGFDSANFGCPASGNSVLIITSSKTGGESGSITATGDICTSSSGGSGGGGGGAPSPTPTPSAITPTNPSVSINLTAVETMSAQTTLALSAVNATQMMISNLQSFSGVSWETYAIAKTWTLSSGWGKKTVYVKFKSSTGHESALASDDIMLLPAQAVKAITASAGGKVGLSDNLVAVDVPVNAVSKNVNVTISPTSVYTAPTGKTKLAGSQVYDFKADADGAAVKTFSKDLTLTFKYTSDDIKGISEGTLAIHYYDETTKKWVKIEGTVDKINKTVTAKVKHFTLFAIFGEEGAVVGQLVKLKCDASNKSICSAVYYVGNDGKRYVFPTEKTYLTWYSDFSGVKEISATELASYKIGGNATYKPGIKMVKITTDPKVYAITKGGVLREIASEAVAKELYGAAWNKQIDDVPDPFFINYKVGAKISAATDYAVATEKAISASINADKGL